MPDRSLVNRAAGPGANADQAVLSMLTKIRVLLDGQKNGSH